MGNAKWWVCNDCKSLNDLPANKCYNCRVEQPDAPQLIDEQYGIVDGGGGGSSSAAEPKRVGVTVDLSKVGDLTSPDPLETATGGGIIEAYGHDDDEPLAMSVQPKFEAPPLREPVQRSISDAGGSTWAERLTGLDLARKAAPAPAAPAPPAEPAAPPVTATPPAAPAAPPPAAPPPADPTAAAPPVGVAPPPVAPPPGYPTQDALPPSQPPPPPGYAQPPGNPTQQAPPPSQPPPPPAYPPPPMPSQPPQAPPAPPASVPADLPADDPQPEQWPGLQQELAEAERAQGDDQA